MKAFFRRMENGEKPGLPRVRLRRCFFTLCYPAMYINVRGKHITLPTGGGKHGPKCYPDIIAELTEEAPIGYKEVAIPEMHKDTTMPHSFTRSQKKLVNKMECLLSTWG